MVPRWRTLSAASRNRELGSIPRSGLKQPRYEIGWFLSKVASFEQDESLESAHELLSAAIVAGADEVAKRTARLLAGSLEVSTPVREFAEHVLEGRGSPLGGA